MNSNLQPFPKIFHLGDRHLGSLYEGEVEITEKIDGSQFVFKKDWDDLYIRSKGTMLYDGDHLVRNITKGDLFYPAVQYIFNIQNELNNEWTYFGETLCRKRHTTLHYNRVPTNYIVLFGVLNEKDVPLTHNEIAKEAERLGMDVVPLLYQGTVDKYRSESGFWLDTFLTKESYLGGVEIEGVVIKAYKEWMLGSQVYPIMSGKYVSEKFKEKHETDWNRMNTGKGQWGSYKASYRSAGRWNKAYQHLKEDGVLTFSPKDIGPLMQEINKDIIEEEKENIKEELWRIYSKELLRYSTAGFPEAYKKYLITGEWEE